MHKTEVELDGAKMITIKETHRYLKEKLNLSPHYGENLDALWDELSTRNTQLSIRIKNLDLMVEQLGDYSEKLIDVIVEAGMYNMDIIFDINAEDDFPI